MIRLIWRSWWRHKERLILLIIGALIISSGLSYMLGLSETSKGTIVDTLQKNWEAQYHILVRPPGSRGVTENENLLSPNYLSGLSGGISLEQWETLKEIKDVEIAAPLAVIGYGNYRVSRIPTELQKLSSDYIYRKSAIIKQDNGHKTLTNKWEPDYYSLNGTTLIEEFHGILPLSDLKSINTYGNILVAGIDPEAEEKLVGLKQAVVTEGKSRYFIEEDKATTVHEEAEKNEEYSVPEQQETKLPILLNNSTFIRTTSNFVIDQIKLSDEEKKVLEDKKKEGKDKVTEYLDTFDGEKIKTFTFNTKDNYELLINELAKNVSSAEKKNSSQYVEVELDNNLTLKTGPVTYKTTTSPFPEKWKYAYEVKPVKNHFKDQFANVYKNSINGYRKITMINDWSEENRLSLKKYIDPYFVGTFDSTMLRTSKNPLTKLPMQTYRPPSAKLVIDSEGNPVNPPETIIPKDSPGGFLLEPPTMLTTIEAAAQIIGEKPISSIRVNVSGVEELTENSQQKLEAVAKQIEDETGLITDITLGSSPQPTLLHIPKSGDIPELGWVQMPWIHLGASFTIFQETKVGFSGVIASVMLVALAYVLATNLVSFLARRKEFAILLAIGWKPVQLIRMIFIESLMVGAFVAIVAWSIEGIYFYQNPASFSLFKLIIVGVLGFLIYLLGAIGPAVLVTRLSPYETMKTGEIRRTSRRISRSSGLFGMSFNHLFGKFGRNIMSIFAMAFPTMLLAFFLFVSLRLQGVLYTTWLGQYAALQVETSHYIAMGIALVIAVLTTAEIMWQNIVERKPEVALLKATGWRNGNVRMLVLLEGLWTGVIAGIFGVVLAIGLIWFMYQQLPMDYIWILVATGIVPMIVGIVGSILPAEIAVRVLPNKGLKEG